MTLSARQRIAEDIDAALSRDPAARGRLYVALTYPGLHAIWLYRVANNLWRHHHHIGAQLVSMFARLWTGVEIHPGATIGRRLFIDHGMGIVIGETAIVGDDCLIYHQVTLGGHSRKQTKRHPTIGNRVLIGAGAKVIGNIEIGDDAKIGANALVTVPVAPGAVIVGVPSTVRDNDIIA
ncbi:MAG: serine O-acetyltransferase [Propionibacteriaceae bacterium]